jgi:hypothetical protein
MPIGGVAVNSAMDEFMGCNSVAADAEESPFTTYPPCVVEKTTSNRLLWSQKTQKVANWSHLLIAGSAS